MSLSSRIVLSACLLGVAANAQQATAPSAEDLPGEIIASYRMGDLPEAWGNFLVFLEHPSRNDLHTDAFARCFYEKRCPQPGALGRILVKPRAELASRIKGFCPRLRSPEVDAALVEAGVPETVVAQQLLRYPAACFAWDEQRLYLGTLGPCAGGVEPDQPHLQGSLAVGFGVEAQDGTRFTASVDTGAWYTNCSAAFGTANLGDQAFALGPHAALADDCLGNYVAK